MNNFHSERGFADVIKDLDGIVSRIIQVGLLTIGRQETPLVVADMMWEASSRSNVRSGP